MKLEKLRNLYAALNLYTEFEVSRLKYVEGWKENNKK